MANTIGRGLFSPMARRTRSVNSAGLSGEPDERSRTQGADRGEQVGLRRVRVGVGQGIGRQPAPGRHQQAVAVEEPAVTARLLLADPLASERAGKQVGGAHRYAGADEEHPLGPERGAGQPPGGEQPGQHHRRRALNVVVEHPGPVAVPTEERERVWRAEVLELDQGAGEDLLHRLHELVHQLEVPLATEPGLGKADVLGGRPQRFVVGPHVEHHGKAARGAQAPARGVEHELPDRDPHSVRAEIAEAEDALAVGDHHDGDVALGPVAEHLPHPPAIPRRHVQSTWAAEDQSELPARFAHGGGVEHRQQRREIVDDGPVEEMLVPVQEVDQVEMLVERALLQPAQVGEDPPHLLLLGEDTRREEPLSPNASRSSSLNAVPRLSRGSWRISTPRGARRSGERLRVSARAAPLWLGPASLSGGCRRIG